MVWGAMMDHAKHLLQRACWLLLPVLSGVLLLAASGVVEVRHPEPDIGVQSLAGRKVAQMATVGQFKVFYAFNFVNRVKESGITFVHHAVDDAARNYVPAHYDHGSGLAVADVDSDGLYDLYFVNQVGGNELWKNLGGGKFKNITAEAGVGLPGRVSVGASFADIDNDGDQDLFVTTVRGGNVLFENDGHGHFTDITKQAGLDLSAHSSGAVFFDFDGDGLVDLLVMNVGRYTSEEVGPQGEYKALPDAFEGHLHPGRYEYPVLYKNMGHNRFKDVTQQVGLSPTGWCGDASFVDLNGSGFPSVFFVNMQGRSHYYENAGGRKFTDRTTEHFPRTPWGAMGIKFVDFDNDGRMDLFVTDMHSDMSTPVDADQEKRKSAMQWTDSYLQGSHSDFIWGNAFYHNLGAGRFEEISDKLQLENYWPWGVSVGDLNADGWQDVFIASGMGFPFRYGINSLLLNNAGQKFMDAEFILGIEPRQDPYTPWFELDCGQGGLSPVNKKICEGKSGTVRAFGTRSSRSSVIFDLDNDGDLDIVTNDFNSEPQVLVSDLAQKKAIHWLKVVLVGTRSNRDGLGATVRVSAGGKFYTQYNDGKSGYLSQSVLPLYFGLGETAKIDRIEVDWPSGQKQVLNRDLEENRVVQIKEPM